RFVLAVEYARDRSGTALVGQAFDAHGPLKGADVNRDLVADAHILRRLAALAAEFDLAALHRLLRGRTRLEKTRGPQPFVDADGHVAQSGSGIALRFASAIQPRMMR